MTPEPCLNLAKGSRCYSHTACGDFGYCRERNMVDEPPNWTTHELIARRRREAVERAVQIPIQVPAREEGR